MKLSRNSPLKNTGFQNYFEAFIENKSGYVLKEAEVELGTLKLLNQTLPYIILLVSPILLVLLIAIQKRI